MDYISRIIGRNLSGVEQLVGLAQEKEVVHFYRQAPNQVGVSLRAYFLEKSLEVQFIDGVADWITLYAKSSSQVNLISSFIQCFHLTNVEAPISNGPVGIRYYNREGLAQIHIYKTALNQIESIHIKAFTR